MQAAAATNPQAVTDWLPQTNQGAAISFTVNFAGCGSTTVWRGRSIARSRFQGPWLPSLAEPVVEWYQRRRRHLKFKAGDKAKLRSSGGVVTESSAGEKLSNTKKSPK
nr:avidin/streptavidin family protein [Bradyrhizobium zhanjiangense]